MTTAVITKQPLAIVTLMDRDNPDPVFWPNNTCTHGTSVGYEVDGWQFVSVQYDSPPNRFYDQASPELTPVSLNGAVLQVSRQWKPVQLAAAKAELLVAVDAAAETQRLLYITSGSGQALVYDEKRREAAAFLADQSPDPTKYPLLSASVGIDGVTIADVASFVSTVVIQWTAIAARIEKARLTAKAAINAAQTVDRAFAIVNTLDWS